MHVLLTRTHPLPDGARVRLRLPQAGDRAGLVALHERLGAPLDDVRMSRILRFDPRACMSVCATMLTGLTEVLVAYGHVDRDGTSSLVVADEVLAPGVTELVRAALVERSRPAGGRSSVSEGGAGCPAEEPRRHVA
jgi:hypothetical protein